MGPEERVGDEVVTAEGQHAHARLGLVRRRNEHGRVALRVARQLRWCGGKRGRGGGDVAARLGGQHGARVVLDRAGHRGLIVRVQGDVAEVDHAQLGKDLLAGGEGQQLRQLDGRLADLRGNTKRQ